MGKNQHLNPIKVEITTHHNRFVPDLVLIQKVFNKYNNTF